MNTDEKKWFKGFNQALKNVDLKKLKDLCTTESLFFKMRDEIIASNNSHRRDVVNVIPKAVLEEVSYSNKGHYTSADYTKAEVRIMDEGDLDTLQVIKARRKRFKRSTEVFKKGDTVLFTSEDHYYHGQKGTIVQLRGKGAMLVNILTKAPIKNRGEVQPSPHKALLWTSPDNLVKVG